MGNAPPIAESTKPIDLENLRGSLGTPKSQECVCFDLACEIDQPAIAHLVQRLLGALEQRDGVRHLTHPAPGPREKRVGERDAPSVGHLLAHCRAAFQGLARLVEVSFKEGRCTEVRERERSHSGIPLLSRIPIVGALFSTRSNTLRRTELLVLITPSVVENPRRARAVTQELRNRLRTLEELEARVR